MSADPPAAPLPDGRYDVLVIDAGEDGLELTLVAGEHKGEVLAVSSSANLGDPVDLMGMPATLVVTDGVPSVTIDG